MILYLMEFNNGQKLLKINYRNQQVKFEPKQLFIQKWPKPYSLIKSAKTGIFPSIFTYYLVFEQVEFFKERNKFSVRILSRVSLDSCMVFLGFTGVFCS